ncbi:patatin-like phospholipase family protein [Solitalea canadensis]|uniref:Putative esterase of the alpha-beta hydrolase superfamily n=1 Tax=Solitalea canadensis (strain ATCC 29591 / DSM 3403 / JCM 21819 / LMG 8368 / NBRC 15130 / NCIMB 12057 / USAM 9D) TaxID=929556 RepID=H8KXT4_SOLCM|nr:patatin-like phospholipase family protein [Solitalea canadensis]AFD05499.1 putative esterase of the alpha-beta hydrolase superfamily [Solitalea canadensis DSM 3403]
MRIVFIKTFYGNTIKYVLVSLLCLLVNHNLLAQERPKIGLTLSGGGAKGLAHIGILQAIDSVGLKIDYISGTSMGAIMGALYAAGYSGNDLEKISRNTSWDRLLTNQPDLRSIVFEEKSEFDRYAVELPVVKGKIKISSGVLEGEELWLTFAQLFLPVHNIHDFSQLKIPFKCIATDAATGKMVVLEKGNIINAVRASMAIPSVFTTVEYEGKKLIDGGVVRNFPVENVKEMGADYVIGVNVGQGLQSADKLSSVLDILYQVGSYREAEDFLKQVQLCDLFIEPDMEGYSAASFSSADSILQRGKDAAKKFYPQLKRFADSLNQLYPGQVYKRDTIPTNYKIKIDEFKVEGLRVTNQSFVVGKLDMKTGRSYTAGQIADGVRRVFGTRNYNSITYDIDSLSDGKTRMTLYATESPQTTVKMALHYNSFSDIAAIVNITSRNFLIKNSRSLLTLNIGKDPKLRAEYFKYLGNNRNWGFTFALRNFNTDLPVYQDFKQVSLYRYNYGAIDSRLQYAVSRFVGVGVGTSYEITRLKPKLSQAGQNQGWNYNWNTYFYYDMNSLDRKQFPTSGIEMYARLSYIYGQNPSVDYYDNLGRQVTNLDSVGLFFKPYIRSDFKFSYYRALSKHSTLIWNAQAGINFNQKQSFLNQFVVGGVTDFLRNQVTFVGLREANLTTSSIATGMIGYQYELYRNIFLTGKFNLGYYDFNGDFFDDLVNGSWLSGYGVSVGYKSAAGPLELTIMRCDQKGSVSAYVNLGFHF